MRHRSAFVVAAAGAGAAALLTTSALIAQAAKDAFSRIATTAAQPRGFAIQDDTDLDDSTGA